MPKTKDGMTTADRISELFAALMKGSRTERDLSEMSGLHPHAVARWLEAMSVSGVASIGGTQQGRRRGKPARLWELNPYPFMKREGPAEGPIRRVYVAGPMTGIVEHNFPAFNEAARRLRELGLEVINPAELNVGLEADWAACMKGDIPHLLTCDTVALLPGWERSRGAQVESRLARDLGLKTLDLEDLVASIQENARPGPPA